MIDPMLLQIKKGVILDRTDLMCIFQWADQKIIGELLYKFIQTITNHLKPQIITTHHIMRKKSLSPPQDESFLRSSGYKVHHNSQKTLKKCSKRTKNDGEPRRLDPELFKKFLPRCEQEGNQAFLRDFQQFQYRNPQFCKKNLQKSLETSPVRSFSHEKHEDEITTKCVEDEITTKYVEDEQTHKRPDHPSSLLSSNEQFRLKIQAAFRDLARKGVIRRKTTAIGSVIMKEQKRRQIGLTLSEHIQQNQAISSPNANHIDNMSNQSMKPIKKRKKKPPGTLADQRQKALNKKIMADLKELKTLPIGEKTKLQAQLFKVDILKKTCLNDETILSKIKKKKIAMQQYLNILKLQSKEYAVSDQEEVKKSLLKFIFTKINQPPSKSLQLQYEESLQGQEEESKKRETNEEQKQPHSVVEKENELKQQEHPTIQETPQTKETKKMIMTRRIAKELCETDSKLELLQLKTTYKADSLKKFKFKTRSDHTKTCKKIQPTKSKSRTKHKQSYEAPQKGSRNSDFDELLLKQLPVRNPITKHEYNSQDHNQILFTEQLKKNRLYYVSDLMSFKQDRFTIACKPKYSNYIEELLKSTRHCRGLIPPPDSLAKKIKLKRNFQYTNKKILALDLDETLVHSQGLNQIPNKQIFPFSFDFQTSTRHYAIRNYALEFIKNLSQKYYLVVFTSAVQGYADNIVEHLDPQEKYIQHRLYRNHCFLQGDAYPYIKDLRILNRDLSQVMIVDNALYAYWFQVDNGVPICSFTGEQDWQLKKLEKYLLKLENVDDVREVNRRTFHMHLYQELDSSKELLEKYCQLMNSHLEKQQ